MAQARFDAERATYFPPGRSAVGAHVTLFHSVPAAVADLIRADLADAAQRSSFPVEVTDVFSLGRGVAYRLNSAELAAIHRELQKGWWAHLSAQDRQGFRAHVTVQNKVSSEQAAQTLIELADPFVPFTVQAEALRLWRYDGGPWTHLIDYPFAR